MSQQFRILCVCTGNVYRSRITQDELRRGIRERLGDRAESFVIMSAGTRATTGVPLEPAYLEQLDGLGVDRRSLGAIRQLVSTDIRAADLILAAHREHRRVVLELVPGAMRRTFVLGELARVAGPASELADVGAPAVDADPVVRAKRVVAAAAKHRGFVRTDDSDDIVDPWGQSTAVLELVARQAREAVSRALDVLVGARDNTLLRG